MSYRKKPPTCHPERKHYSFGMCRACYNKYHRAKNPDQYAAEKLTHKKYVKKHRQAKTAFTTALKKDRPCMDCGQEFPHYVMDFDHVRGVKMFEIGRARGRFSKERLLAEVDKCELVCSNCHRIRTWTRKEAS